MEVDFVEVDCMEVDSKGMGSAGPNSRAAVGACENGRVDIDSPASHCSRRSNLRYKKRGFDDGKKPG